jgi:hypothetical protein
MRQPPSAHPRQACNDILSLQPEPALGVGQLRQLVATLAAVQCAAAAPCRAPASYLQDVGRCADPLGVAGPQRAAEGVCQLQAALGAERQARR